MNAEQSKHEQLIKGFYETLNRPAAQPVEAVLREIAAEDWRSYSGESTSKSRAEFIAQVIGFGKMIPDLAWTVEEAIFSGDRYPPHTSQGRRGRRGRRGRLVVLA